MNEIQTLRSSSMKKENIQHVVAVGLHVCDTRVFPPLKLSYTNILIGSILHISTHILYIWWFSAHLFSVKQLAIRNKNVGHTQNHRKILAVSPQCIIEDCVCICVHNDLVFNAVIEYVFVCGLCKVKGVSFWNKSSSYITLFTQC